MLARDIAPGTNALSMVRYRLWLNVEDHSQYRMRRHKLLDRSRAVFRSLSPILYCKFSKAWFRKAAIQHRKGSRPLVLG